MYYQGERYSKWYDDLGVSNQKRGVGYTTNDGELINEPFDFSYKNYVSLLDQQDILMRIITPEAFSPEERFDLTAADYELLYQAMSQRPRVNTSFPERYTSMKIAFTMTASTNTKPSASPFLGSWAGRCTKN